MMDEIFENEFVTWRHTTPVGVKVDEVFGMDSKSGKIWRALARQIFCELGDFNYREIYHYENGAPYIEGLKARFSLSHTNHLLVGAILPKTPDQNLEIFNPRTAMGIDAENLDRSQVLKIRTKFLSQQELELVPEDDLEANIVAWTSKEALYKAALTPGIDFKEDIKINRLPVLAKDGDKNEASNLGSATIILRENSEFPTQEMELYSYESYGCCVTIAVSPKAAKFKKPELSLK